MLQDQSQQTTRHNPQNNTAATIEPSLKPSEVRKLSRTDRSKLLQRQAEEAAKEFHDRPDLLIEGANELLDY